MTSARFRILGGLALGLMFLGLPSWALELRVTEHGAEASEVTPGGEVAWLTVWREQDELYQTHVTLLDRTLGDEDRDGMVTLETEQSVPRLSVWAAVDVTTGKVALATPEGVPLRFAPEGSIRLKPPRLEVDLERLEMILVRPGVGAFRARVASGGRDDVAQNHLAARVALTPAAFRRAVPDSEETPRGKQPDLPQRFQAGDVLVGIDMRTLEVVLAEVD